MNAHGTPTTAKKDDNNNHNNKFHAPPVCFAQDVEFVFEALAKKKKKTEVFFVRSPHRDALTIRKCAFQPPLFSSS